IPMDKRVLFTSREVRQNVGPVEEYLIRIPADVLKPAGIPMPVDRSVAREEPQVMVSKLRQAVEFHVAVADETRNIAAARVDTARKLARATDAVVESRITESLTGMNAQQAELLNFVPPGAKPEPTVWRTAKRNIENDVNSNPIAGYLV